MKNVENKSLTHEMSALTVAEMSSLLGGGFKVVFKFTYYF